MDRRLRPEPLDPESVDPDPLVQFRRWYDAAVAAGVRQPDAMTLATVAADGAPDARTVLLRGLDERGFAFYTNLESAKARELPRDPPGRARVPLARARAPGARARDRSAALDRDEATQYWEQRPRGHRSARGRRRRATWWTPTTLAGALAEVEARFAGDDPPLPPFWGGYVVASDELELWQGRKDRLHDRVRYRPGSTTVVAPRTARAVNAARRRRARRARSLFAVGDWWSRCRDDKRLEYVCKPATMVALIVVARRARSRGRRGRPALVVRRRARVLARRRRAS